MRLTESRRELSTVSNEAFPITAEHFGGDGTPRLLV